MTTRFVPAIAFLAAFFLLAACGHDTSPEKPKFGYLPDSLEGQTGQELPEADAGAGSHKNELKPSGQQTGASETFEQRNARFISSVLPDYKEADMDPLDAFPVFKVATASEFKRLRKVKPTRTSVGNSTYPRLLVRNYRFASWEALVSEVEAWFDGMEHGQGEFKLGKEMEAMKWPPMLCLADGNHFTTVQWSCIYANDEWTATEKKFFEWAEAEKVKYAFELSCQAGKLKYHIKES